MPDIRFENSQKSENKRWKQTQKEVQNGWFVNHGFLVFPRLRADVAAQVQVVFPKSLEYEKVGVEKFVREWRRVEEGFWRELDHYLPEAHKKHSLVLVDVGRVGTISSSYWSTTHYYLRADRGVGDLVAMMINQTLFELRKEMGITWTKREALMDFVMTRPVMRRLFPDFDPILNQLLRVPAKIRLESENYVRSLGYVLPGNELAVLGGKVVVKGKEVGRDLGKKEQILLKLLIQHKGELVTYDELADSIWGEGEFKSFWALAKLVERARRGLVKLGIDPKRVESVRAQGYVLV